MPCSAHEVGRTVTANRYPKRIYVRQSIPRTPRVAALPTRLVLRGRVRLRRARSRRPAAGGSGRRGRADPTPSRTTAPGFEVRTYRTCRRILMFHHFPDELRQRRASSCGSIDFELYRTVDDPRSCAAGLLAAASIDPTRMDLGARLAGSDRAASAAASSATAHLTIDDTLRTADADSLENIIGDFDGAHRRWVDLLGEGLQGILTEDDGAWYYKQNLSALLRRPARRRSLRAARAPRREAATHGLRHRAPAHRSQRTRSPVRGQLPAADCGLARVATLTAAGSRCARSRPRTSTGGPEPALRRPRRRRSGRRPDHRGRRADLVPVAAWNRVRRQLRGSSSRLTRTEARRSCSADGARSIFLADMSRRRSFGPGASPRRRDRATGRTSATVASGRRSSWTSAPMFDNPDLFDERRLRLADIDGSGTADLVYFGSDQHHYLVQPVGQRLDAGPPAAPQFPTWTTSSQATVFDLLGTGTACDRLDVPPARGRRGSRCATST